jgi:hypothetical protein
MKRLVFYPAVSFLVVLDGLLLSRPNLLGKVGLKIYHYTYLRSFPKALLTATVVIGIAVVICEAIVYFANSGTLGRRVSNAILLFLVVICAGLLIKTTMDFSGGSYGYTGIQFRIGACLLPLNLLLVFLFGLTKLPKRTFPTAEAALVEEANRIINSGT